jgi:hypothetical protein
MRGVGVRCHQRVGVAVGSAVRMEPEPLQKGGGTHCGPTPGVCPGGAGVGGGREGSGVTGSGGMVGGGSRPPP